MNEKLNKINESISLARDTAKVILDPLLKTRLDALGEVFEADCALNEAIVHFDNRAGETEYYIDECGSLMEFGRIRDDAPFKAYIDAGYEKELRDWITKTYGGIYFNSNHMTLESCQGDYIGIDLDTADVYESETGKLILKGSDYNTESELYEAIEAYMDEMEYYPSVMKVDRYGQVLPVNTSTFRKEGRK